MKTNRVRRTSTAARSARQSQTATPAQHQNGTAQVRVDVPVDTALLDVLDKAAKAAGCDRDTFIRQAVSERIARATANGAESPRQSEALKEMLLKPIATPAGRLTLDELGGDGCELWQDAITLEEVQDECAALFYLMRNQPFLTAPFVVPSSARCSRA